MEDDRVEAEAEVRAPLLEAEECLWQPEAGRGKQGCFSRSFGNREHGPTNILISDFQPQKCDNKFVALSLPVPL